MSHKGRRLVAPGGEGEAAHWKRMLAGLGDGQHQGVALCAQESGAPQQIQRLVERALKEPLER
jgi:hypothetical protein